jgi:periplasmic copper chaperone A
MNLRKAIGAVTFALGVLAAPGAAQAHVTLQPAEAPAGEFTRLDIRAPNERDDASTEKVDVKLPDGFLFVSTEPVAGWSTRMTRERLRKPQKALGETVREQVTRVTLTARQDSAKIGPGEFRDFGLSVLIPDRPGRTLTFKALQTYDSGEVVRWIGPPDAEEPAPRVRIVRSSESPTDQSPQPSGGEGDEDSDAVSIAALVVGGLALLTAVAALAVARRARRRGT